MLIHVQSKQICGRVFSKWGVLKRKVAGWGGGISRSQADFAKLLHPRTSKSWPWVEMKSWTETSFQLYVIMLLFWLRFQECYSLIIPMTLSDFYPKFYCRSSALYIKTFCRVYFYDFMYFTINIRLVKFYKF